MLHEQSTWKGPYLLSSQMVEKLILHDGPGMYALGEQKRDKRFEMQYIGSSASLKNKLKSFLGKYQLFMFDSFIPEDGMFTDKHALAEYKIKVNEISDRD